MSALYKKYQVIIIMMIAIIIIIIIKNNNYYYYLLFIISLLLRNVFGKSVFMIIANFSGYMLQLLGLYLGQFLFQIFL